MGAEGHQNEGGVQQGGEGVRGQWRHRFGSAQEAKEGGRQASQEGQEERVFRGGGGGRERVDTVASIAMGNVFLHKF